jgi:flavin-dependent dehydrogenase
LTRRPRKVAFERALVLGDAAGYVEPFTGEGMAWALNSAVTITPLAVEAIRRWTPGVGHAWQQLQQRTAKRRQFACRQLARGLRYPALVRAVIKLLGSYPQLAQPVIKQLNLR